MRTQFLAFTQGKTDGACLWFHFSGHGTQITGELSGDEADNKDEALVPSNWDKTAKGLISDDWLYDNLVCKVPAGGNCSL